ncbi:hypothetical protein HNP52_000543 [Sphingomonas kyeonggiensis]|uniref:Uncharacterized protein n=1 Tax=Sphingomonas kyeonggiensis TaxID=1268553 RepID=A0A7W7JYR7_9SPHN|nr:hypothetical protein [Sphingomonas kyeonggiensis]MBB4837492.1 hypothetical protein [Sphingomonas kyeonggiensis]
MSLSLEAALAELRGLQVTLNEAAAEAQEVEEGDEAEWLAQRLLEPDYCTRLSVADLGGALAVDYRGSEYEGWGEFLDLLGRPGVARHIVQLRISGPDEGANGLKEWDFAPLIEADPDFSRLRAFQVAISDPGDHNQACITDGQLPALIARMPALRTLELPQAPEPGFFALDLSELRRIRTGGDWDTRGFVGHLAEATRLPALGFIDFADSSAPFMSLQSAQASEWDSTPFADYERLFRSPVLERAWGIRLRNTRLTEAEYRALAAIRPKCQFSVVLASPHVYVSHWGTSDFPYRHLLPFG